MKNLDLTMDAAPTPPRNSAIQPTEQPLKISIVFDDELSASSAEVLIRRVASDFPCDTQSFAFQKLARPGPAVAAARSASDTDILVLAVRDDRMLPPHVQSWLGLCLGLRDQDQEGALVALIAKAVDTAESKSPLLEYLERIATMGRLEFFPRRRSDIHSASKHGGLAARWSRHRARHV
jgi:hypothetical protein